MSPPCRPTEKWGVGRSRGYLPGTPKLVSRKGAPWGFSIIFTFLGCIFMLFFFPLHCLDWMSECLGKIISNTFDYCRKILQHVHKHAEPTPLINCHTYNEYAKFLVPFCAWNLIPAPPAFSAALVTTAAEVLSYTISHTITNENIHLHSNQQWLCLP